MGGQLQMERDVLLAELAEQPERRQLAVADTIVEMHDDAVEMHELGPSELAELAHKLTAELAEANNRISRYEQKVSRLSTVEAELAVLVPVAMRGAGAEPAGELEKQV